MRVCFQNLPQHFIVCLYISPSSPSLHLPLSFSPSLSFSLTLLHSHFLTFLSGAIIKRTKKQRKIQFKICSNLNHFSILRLLDLSSVDLLENKSTVRQYYNSHAQLYRDKIIYNYIDVGHTYSDILRNIR